VAGDTEFNEAFATAVGEEGVRRWFEVKGDPVQLERVEKDRARRQQFVQLILDTRDQLNALYESDRSADEKRFRKKEILAGLRDRYNELKANEWNGFDGYDEWFDGPLNNAQLNTVSTYYTLVPAFHHLLKEANGDFAQFYTAASRLTKLSKPERHQRLVEILKRKQVETIARANDSDPVKSAAEPKGN